MPEYFNEKINLGILLAPVAGWSNQPNKILRFESQPEFIKLALGLLDTIHMWNIFPQNMLTTEGRMVVCSYFSSKLCDLVLSMFVDADPSVDITTPERYSMALSNMPAGSGIYTYVHYAQLIVSKTDAFKRFDHGKEENMKRYGQESPPDYDLSVIDYPIGIFSGDSDLMADPKDVKWTAEQLNHTLVFNQEYHLGHLSFAMAKDMTFFTKDVMDLIKQYNP